MHAQLLAGGNRHLASMEILESAFVGAEVSVAGPVGEWLGSECAFRSASGQGTKKGLRIMIPSPQGAFQCGRQDLNLHEVALASPSS